MSHVDDSRMIVAVHVERLAIVPPALFETVRTSMRGVPALVEGRAAFRRSHARNVKYLLSGIAACGHCGNGMRLASSHRGFQRMGCGKGGAERPVCETKTFLGSVSA